MAVVFIEQKRDTQLRDGEMREVTRTEERVISVATIRGIFSSRFMITGLDPLEARDLERSSQLGADGDQYGLLVAQPEELLGCSHRPPGRFQLLSLCCAHHDFLASATLSYRLSLALHDSMTRCGVCAVFFEKTSRMTTASASAR
jgi:hypothetical protein